MRRRASFRSLVVLPALLLGACTGDDPGRDRVERPRLSLADAAARTVEAGPAAVVARVRAGGVRYRMRGTWDPTRGYRLCGPIEEGPTRYIESRVLWLEGRAHSYDTLTAHGRRCRRDRNDWFDDHPPTLELFDPQRSPGAEDHLHAALLALGGLKGTTVDFRAFDRDPHERDEDGWTLRPLLRRMGTRTVEVEVGRRGLIDLLRLVGPRGVEVRLSLSRHGELRRVQHAVAYAIE